MKKVIYASVFGLIIGFVTISMVVGKGAGSSKYQDAIKRVQMYETKNNSSLSVYMENLVLIGIKADPTTSTGVWSAESVNESTYNVTYKFRTSGQDQVFVWEVDGDSIKAINGKAISATPELGPQEKEVSGSNLEKEIFEYSIDLYNKYETTLGSYEAETRATSETSKKFNITEEEVEAIVKRLMDTKN